jgi:histone deacetylase 1/2
VTDFCGVRYDKLPGGGYALSCGKLLKRLHSVISQDSDAIDYQHETPMAEDALTRLFLEAPARDGTFVTKARSILGIGGYVVCQARPDAYFAFIVLSQLVGRGITNNIWKAILRWAWYLVNTKDLKLYYHRGDGSLDWVAYTDSSMGNAQGAGSYGGAAFHFPGSGLFAWMVKVPKAKTDSTGGAELLMASLAGKAILGWRIFSRELSLPVQGPNVLKTDSKATLDCIMKEGTSTQQRYVSIRAGMLREMVNADAVRLEYVGSDENIADVFTKPLGRLAFLRLRDLVLGCPDGGLSAVD